MNNLRQSTKVRKIKKSIVGLYLSSIDFLFSIKKIHSREYFFNLITPFILTKIIKIIYVNNKKTVEMNYSFYNSFPIRYILRMYLVNI